MKFGKHLASRQLELPEYSGHFIDYKGLKKLIKQLAIPTGGTTTTSQIEIQTTLKENKASFFFRVERELEKVNSFYLEKQSNLAINLDLLLLKKTELFNKSAQFIHQQEDTTHQNANFKNSISYLNLYQNFKKIHQDLLRLQQFIELNETGFSKVVKKWDKRSKSHTKELFISTAVSVQPVFHKHEINDLSDLVSQSLFDIESIMDGDYTCLVSYNGDKNNLHPGMSRHDSIVTAIDRTSPSFNNSRHSSIVNLPAVAGGTTSSGSAAQAGATASAPAFTNNHEIDELYSSFVNVAKIKDPDLSLLAQWVNKVKSSSKGNTSLVKYKITKIFLLSITNLKISDTFLQSFLDLIQYEVDFTCVNDSNKNILHECCSIGESSTETTVHINNGVKVINPIDSILHSRTFIVKYIIEQHQHLLLTGRDDNGRNCLHYAAQNNRVDLLDIILPCFPQDHIDDLDNDSMSCLLLAIKHGNFLMIKKLVVAGANCFPQANKEKLQYLPINYACQFGDYKTLEYLLSSTKTPTLVNQPDVEGLFPLHVVCRSGHYKLIKLLIEYGSEINQLDGFNKWTPIFYACSEGYIKTTQELMKFGAKLNIIDEDGYNVLYYCVVEGHIDVVNELLSHYSTIQSGQEEHVTREEEDEDDSEDSEAKPTTKDNNGGSDSIPDLQLPPPILPLRRYGHNFLEQKILIELKFSDDFITLFNSSRDLKPGRITLTSNISDIVPRNILLPMDDDIKSNCCVFQTDIESLNEFRIDFEIFPKFGTRLIAKTTAMTFTSGMNPAIKLPLFDLRLRNIGELKFNYQIIFPFSGMLLETSKFDTYWKSSTSFVKSRQMKLNAAGGLSPNNFLSPTTAPAAAASTTVANTTAIPGTVPAVLTATSLSGEYLRIRICLLNDGTPVVCPHWSIAITDTIELYLPNLSLEQLTSITDDLFDYSKVIHDLSTMTIQDISSIKNLLKIIYLPLDIILKILDDHINLNLEIIFPSLYEFENLPFISNLELNLNKFIDFTLDDVFNHIRSCKTPRSIIFLSSNSLICKILNWKQPNFPVFLIMNGINYNIHTKKFESRTTNGLLLNQAPADQELTITSIKQAVNFTINNNLIGLITSIHLLNLVPKLIPLIKSRGLVLVASSEDEELDPDNKELDCYTKTEINGLRFDDVLSFKEDISM
ncbi:Phosphate system positive regulatory protein PHO81 [Spathaspora sp. JA1]|nr:Phosphate system positive regulatory protein PHO81 [Spathaspora sp. JA1]